MNDFFNAKDKLTVGGKDFTFYRLDALEKAGLTTLSRLPFSIRIVLEAALRQCNDVEITQDDVKNIAMDVLRHRVTVTYEAEAEGLDSERIIARILDELPVP